MKKIIREIIDLLDAEEVKIGYAARCPFHRERTPSFIMRPKKDMYHCFGCGAHGDMFDLEENLRMIGKLK